MTPGTFLNPAWRSSAPGRGRRGQRLRSAAPDGDVEAAIASADLEQIEGEGKSDGGAARQLEKRVMAIIATSCEGVGVASNIEKLTNWL
jgi:hypothetical protein